MNLSIKAISNISCLDTQLSAVSKLKKLRVRYACPDDSELIAQIAEAVNIHKYAYLGKGFLVYTLSSEEYRKRICDGQHVYVFMHENQVVGFICGYDKDQFESYLVDGTLGHEPFIGRRVQGLALKNTERRYAFLDQIAILPKYQDRGFGEIYFSLFCNVTKGPYYVAMAELPLYNPRIEYWCSRGFIRVGSVQEHLLGRFESRQTSQSSILEMVWGIYVLPDQGFKPFYAE